MFTKGILKQKNEVFFEIHFKPISIDEIDFYLNAIKKGYYDKEVWS